MFDAATNSLLREIETSCLPVQSPFVVTSVDSTSLAPQKGLERAASLFSKSPNENVLDLIVYWDQPIAELKRVLDGISDWGPFELTDAAPLAFERDQKVSVFCRFHYHGPKASRDHFERNLKVLLEESAAWDDARPPGHSA